MPSITLGGPHGTFLAESFRSFRATGAIAPSGRRLAMALAAPLGGAGGAGPLRVLEAGAGTGAVTRELIERLPPGGELDLVEANPRFETCLRELVARATARGRAGAGAVRTHLALIEEFTASAPDAGYDVIVSGLPFTNFAPGRVAAIMDEYLRLLRPGGELTFFAYAGTRAVRALFASRAEAARHRSVEAVLAGYRRRFPADIRMTWGNIPPARVWRLRPEPPEPAAALAGPRSGRRVGVAAGRAGGRR
ncbi:class I SAM-dependent methyltransferase [Streptomyces hoynatensis]|uniref:Methyltransferase domain-containing protein n=1 Tax=Streptomyces hoynatensis TaxID=1141874 RepID=A0A3A9ZEY4_9ACTN|nr:methyltransferase domain-containing protein [Streptomyces hoynatensis]RKN46908.1 methyltransferase domain-containing protein [Streptomyces hoynatensis]